MSIRNRLSMILVAIVFMMAMPVAVYSAESYSYEGEICRHDFLRDASSDSDKGNAASWNDAVLPIQLCAPRVVRAEVLFGPSPFGAGFVSGNSTVHHHKLYSVVTKGNRIPPFVILLSRYYYVIALRHIIC